MATLNAYARKVLGHFLTSATRVECADAITRTTIVALIENHKGEHVTGLVNLADVEKAAAEGRDDAHLEWVAGHYFQPEDEVGALRDYKARVASAKAQRLEQTLQAVAGGTY